MQTTEQHSEKKDLFNIADDINIEFEKLKNSDMPSLFLNRSMLESIIRSIPDGLAISDLSGKIIFATKRSLEMWGFDDEFEVIGKNIFNFVPENDFERAKYLFGELLLGNNPGIAEYLMKRIDGTEFHCEINSSIVRNSNNIPINIVYTLRDITAKKNLQERLNALYTAFEQIPVSVVITDTTGKVEYVNPKFCNLTGTCREEIINSKNVLFNYLQRSKNEFDEIIESVLSGNSWTGIVKTLGKDRNKIYESSVISPITDLRGNITGIIAINEDITEHQQHEKILVENEARYRSIFENAPIGILQFDAKGVINSCNKNFVDILGSSFDKLIGLDMRILPDSNIQNILNKCLVGKTAEYEGKYTSFTSGKITQVRVLFSPIINLNNKVVGGIGIVEDIERRKQAEYSLKKSEAELKELNATKDKFFSIIAHDLRSPISTFKNITDMMSTDYTAFSDDERLEMLKLLHKSSLSLSELLDNLLEWSRAQRGIIAFHPEKVNVSYIARECIELISNYAEEKAVNIKLEIGSSIEVFADPYMLKTIFRNLLTNAVKFSHRNKNVIIGQGESEGKINFFVKDNGTGIPPETIKQLFKIGNHITTIGTNNEIGSGLGLILCNEFIKKHKGKIWVESTVNEGSTFYFTIGKK